VQVTQAHIKGSTAPALGSIVAGLIDGGEHRLELLEGQACGDQGLVGVPQYGFYKLDFSCHFYVTSTGIIYIRYSGKLHFGEIWKKKRKNLPFNKNKY